MFVVLILKVITFVHDPHPAVDIVGGEDTESFGSCRSDMIQFRLRGIFASDSDSQLAKI